MDPLWIAVAFVLGFAVRQIGLPPLIGFLGAGFVLSAHGVEAGETVGEIGDVGVTLLLFTIGLKLRIKSLARPEVCGGAALHMGITVIVFGAGIFGLSVAGLSVFGGLDLGTSLLIAFALSFSSTVFAVKVLEEKGEMASLHGRTAIGILIMQDLLAVVFLAFSAGKTPTPWALVLLGLPLVRPILFMLMDRCGHGELLVLFGVLLTLQGASAFELVGLKPDLGALILGVLLAPHPKSSELAKALLSFKHLFLVGFFLSIGLRGVPTPEALGIALLMVLVMPLKVGLFFALLTRFRLRARSGALASLSLANYSEFGLIVASVGVTNGWISDDWLVIIAVALSLTFVLAAPLNTAAHRIYARHAGFLRRFETRRRLPDDAPVDTGDAEVVIIGMSRLGASAYDSMRARHGRTVIGVDHDSRTVREHREAGREVVLGDVTDPDFWERIRPGRVNLVMLALPDHGPNLLAAGRLSASGYEGKIAATARFADEAQALREAGVHAVFDFHTEAGAGFAEHVCRELDGEAAASEHGA